MNLTYKKIFNIALSSNLIEDKVKEIESYWSEINEIELFNLALKDEVASHIAFILKSSDTNYSSFWDKEFLKIENRINVLMNELDLIGEVLYSNNIQIVALKNAGITKALYKNNACSPMGDLDLLVSSKNFRKAHNIIIQDLYYTFDFRSELEETNLDEAFRQGGTEYFKIVDGYKIWLELQWRPIAGRWIQLHNEPNGDRLIENSITIKNSRVRILSPEDNLLQVSLHTAKHSYIRAPGFRLHSDVDRVVRFQTIDWINFCKIVKEKRLSTSVYFSLYFAKELLRTPIPQKYLNILRPNFFKEYGIKSFINSGGIYNQKKKKFSKIGYILFNLLLYDSILEVFRALFPTFKSMKIQFNIKSIFFLPYFYIKRFNNLIFKRASL